jgi:manganese/iron transport system ATP-binding protein
VTAAPARVAVANTAEPAGAALDVRDLHVVLGGRLVLQRADLRVHAGDFLGLIGPNGAGKTTLLRSVLGLVPVASGTVQVAGGTSRAARAGVGYVPQRHEFAWDFPISVEDAVLSGRTRRIGLLRRAQVDDLRAVRDAVDRVGLTDLRRRPVGQLSGGQRQRVLVARALALRPRVLLLDEPFTGLDMPTQELLTGLFTDLAAEGVAVVMTTHDLAGALYSCTRIALLNRTVLAAGTPTEVRDPDLWARAFEISPDSPLLRAIGLEVPA